MKRFETRVQSTHNASGMNCIISGQVTLLPRELLRRCVVDFSKISLFVPGADSPEKSVDLSKIEHIQHMKKNEIEIVWALWGEKNWNLRVDNGSAWMESLNYALSSTENGEMFEKQLEKEHPYEEETWDSKIENEVFGGLCEDVFSSDEEKEEQEIMAFVKQGLRNVQALAVATNFPISSTVWLSMLPGLENVAAFAEITGIISLKRFKDEEPFSLDQLFLSSS